jgi:hypothetical protein
VANPKDFWNVNGNGIGGRNGNGATPPSTPRLGTPYLPPRDPEVPDPFTSSSAADWNAGTPYPSKAPSEELETSAREHKKPHRPWWRRLFGSDEADGYRVDDDIPESEQPGNGVHAITRTTDYWFEREIHSIERGAREQAGEWATKGLPRHDVTRTEPLEPEQVLAAHSAQLFRDWQRRVRTRMQDAIEDGSQAVGRQVAALRNAISRLDAIRGESADLSQRIVRLREEAERDAVKPVRYERYVGPVTFWFGAAVLFLVEFFANFPVFRLLLPMSRALNTAAQSAAENVNDTSWLAGPEMLGREMLMHVEAAVVALVAVFVLVLLGKTLGASLRPLMAFRASEHPLAAQTINAHLRQKAMLALFCALGLGAALSFLYVSRGSIAAMADERVTIESRHLDTLRARSATIAPNDRTRIGQAATEMLAVENNKRFLDDDAAYARTVQKNNRPILALNLALILAAIVLGYSHQAEDLGDKRGEHPGIIAARERLRALDAEMFAALDAGRRAESQAHADIGRVHHLLRASPLREWRSKLQRLEGVIPLFRGENARLRGLDPANIRAFDLPAVLDVPPVPDDESFQEPHEFARLKTEFAQLSAEFARVAPRMTPAFGNATIA